jgi:ethanolamine permease
MDDAPGRILSDRRRAPRVLYCRDETARGSQHRHARLSGDAPLGGGGGVRYEEAPDGYFEQRSLRRHARVGSLWALGVGAVISGDFFGWNFGLAAGGFGGLFVATAIVTVMYAGLCFSIAEMSPALPHTGGAYSFARSAMGPWGAYVTGLAENMEYILTPAVIVVGIGGYLGAIFGTPDSLAPLWWAVAYLAFVGLNVWGVEISFRFTVAITLLALAILFVFYVGALGHVDIERFALDIVPDEGQTRWLPKGWGGVLGALPFAIWFYLAIEQLPLAAEEAHDPVRDMPRGILLGLLTLVVCAFATLVLNTAIAPGASALASSDEPLFDGFRTIFGAGLGTRLLALLAVAGLVASFHSIIFAYGRQIFSLSRAGYFPRWLSRTHPTRQTPHLALVTGAVMGYAVALLIHVLGSEHPVGAVLLNLAVFGAVLSYVLQMASFILLRLRLPGIERPYRSPLGIFGALLALAIAALTMVALFVADPIYQKVVLGALVWYLLGLVYFALYGRHQLVSSPEEAFAQRAHLAQLESTAKGTQS